MRKFAAFMLCTACTLTSWPSVGDGARHKHFSPLITTHFGNGGTALNSGTTDIDGARIFCAGEIGGHCLISAIATVEANNGGSSNPWQICFTVDGAEAKPTCANQQDLPLSHSATGVNMQNMRVDVGATSSVKLQVRASGPGTLGSWSVSYTIY